MRPYLWVRSSTLVKMFFFQMMMFSEFFRTDWLEIIFTFTLCTTYYFILPIECGPTALKLHLHTCRSIGVHPIVYYFRSSTIICIRTCSFYQRNYAIMWRIRIEEVYLTALIVIYDINSSWTDRILDYWLPHSC